jgi:ABC-type transport system substrate-binding protein
VNQEKRALFNIPEFRKAVSIAIDRQRISDEVYDGQTTLESFSYIQRASFVTPFKLLDSFDLQAAKALLDGIPLLTKNSSGYYNFASGTPLSIVSLQSDQVGSRETAKVIDANMHALGLDLKVQYGVDVEVARSASRSGVTDFYMCGCGTSWLAIASAKDSWTPPYDPDEFSPHIGVGWAKYMGQYDEARYREEYKAQTGSYPPVVVSVKPPDWVYQMSEAGLRVTKYPATSSEAISLGTSFASTLANERWVLGTVALAGLQIVNTRAENVMIESALNWDYGQRLIYQAAQMFYS